MAARSLHAPLHNYATKSPLVRMARHTSTPKIAPCHGAIINFNYQPHPWTQPTNHPKRHPDLISRLSTIHWIDGQRQTNWQMGHATKPVPIPAYALHDDMMKYSYKWFIHYSWIIWYVRTYNAIKYLLTNKSKLTLVRCAWRIMVWPVRWRSILSYHCYVVLILHFTIKGCSRANDASVTIHTELLIVNTNLFDPIVNLQVTLTVCNSVLVDYM